jgi:hypothetical protein
MAYQAPQISDSNQPLPQLANLVAHLRRCFELQVAGELVHLLFQRLDTLGDLAR